MHTEIIVEGASIPVRQTQTEQGETLIEARPVIEHLKGEISLDGTILGVRRYHDRANLSIDMADGKVRAGTAVLGKLPEWTPREVADTWISLNAIAILTGTHISQNEAGTVTLTLDDKLRPQFDLDLFVDGRRLPFVENEPRTIGAILLVPLVDIADALGHEIRQDTDLGTVTVVRVQDSARITLELSTGLVLLNDVPQGLTAYMSYADPDTLLLPYSAVESLTGTHITLEPGSDRIDVRLDDRLSGAAAPGAYVDEEAASTGFVPERLSYTLDDRGNLNAGLSARVRSLNTQTRLETRSGSLEPSWLGTEIQSLDGWRGSIGDATPDYREMSGVDVSRIRGVTYQTLRDNGDLVAVAGGLPSTGSVDLGEDGNRPTFGGFAAGVRLIQPDKQREIGVSALNDDLTDSTALVASYQQDILTQAGADDRIGLGGIFATADVGAFTERSESLGIRGQVDAVYKLSSVSNLRAALSHESEAFRSQPVVDDTDDQASSDFQSVFDTRVGARTSGRLSVDWRAVDNYDLFHNVAAGVQLGATQIGDASSQTASASVSGRIGENGVDVSASLGVSNSQSDDGEGDGVTTTLNVRALKRFDWGMVQANLTSADAGNGERNTRLVANVTGEPINRTLENGVTMSVAPSFVATASEDTQFASLGGSAFVDSGPALGDRARLRAQVSALQSIDPDDSQTRFFARIGGHYDILPNLRLEGSYSDDFDGSSRFTLGLRGAVTFNPPRKHTRPIQDTGVLRGQVFFDRNRDGVRQDDEPGIPGVRVSIRMTRLGLQVDPRGEYTIQNLPTGLYSMSVDRRTLPLGFLVPEDARLRATIADGRVTDLDIPIIASGQVRGTVFDDLNGNGAVDAGETRHEGARMTLERINDAESEDEDEPNQQYAAGFGQFAFENLSPGDYRLTAEVGGRPLVKEFTLTEDNLFMVQPFGYKLPPNEPLKDGTPLLDGGIDFAA